MSVYEFIDQMILRLNGVEVKGAANMQAIIQTIQDLAQLKGSIRVDKEDENADGHNEQGADVPG